MEVKINKEIREYTENMFFGLSMRQFFFSVLACLAAVGLYFMAEPYLGSELGTAMRGGSGSWRQSCRKAINAHGQKRSR